jgi:hypothetical protein
MTVSPLRAAAGAAMMVLLLDLPVVKAQFPTSPAAERLANTSFGCAPTSCPRTGPPLPPFNPGKWYNNPLGTGRDDPWRPPHKWPNTRYPVVPAYAQPNYGYFETTWREIPVAHRCLAQVPAPTPWPSLPTPTRPPAAPGAPQTAPGGLPRETPPEAPVQGPPAASPPPDATAPARPPAAGTPPKATPPAGGGGNPDKAAENGAQADRAAMAEPFDGEPITTHAF